MSVLLIGALLGASGAVDRIQYYERRAWRQDFYQTARAMATDLRRPLIVIGAPDGWGAGVDLYGCGDTCLDLDGCARCGAKPFDLSSGIPFDDDSAVVFVSCVLEYVPDLDAVYREIVRVAGGESRVFIVHIRPESWWTLFFYRPENRNVILSAPPLGPFAWRSNFDAREIVPR
jgi:SAM-dependent methyltransferase